MDIQRNGNKWPAGPSGIGYTPADIDPDGLKILVEAGFVWDSHLLAFTRSSSRSTIEYGFLREQKLFVNSALDQRERAGQLQRLRILIQSLD